MCSRHSILIATAPLVVLLACVRNSAAPDPLAPAFRRLEPSSIASVSISSVTVHFRPLSVAADQWPSLLGLLHALEPAPEAPALSASSPSPADWQVIGSVFVTLRSPTEGMQQGRAPFIHICVARHSRSPAVVAFVYSGRDQLFRPYRGGPLSAWVQARLRGA